MPRLPAIFDRDALPEGQREVHDYLVKTRGAVSPGFGPLLHQPELAARIAHLGTFIRFESSLPAHVRELAALTAATEMDAAYEQAQHLRQAREAGLSEETLDVALTRKQLDGLAGDEALAIACARSLLDEHRLPDGLYAEALSRYGAQGVIELLATIGYYAMLACLHNALEIGPPGV